MQEAEEIGKSVVVLAWPIFAGYEIKEGLYVPTLAAVAAAYGLTRTWPWNAPDVQTFLLGYLGAGVAFLLSSEQKVKSLI